MPFRSAKQRAFLEIHHPDVAKKFASETTHAQEMSLPAKVKGKHTNIATKKSTSGPSDAAPKKGSKK